MQIVRNSIPEVEKPTIFQRNQTYNDTRATKILWVIPLPSSMESCVIRTENSNCFQLSMTVTKENDVHDIKLSLKLVREQFECPIKVELQVLGRRAPLFTKSEFFEKGLTHDFGTILQTSKLAYFAVQLNISELPGRQ